MTGLRGASQREIGNETLWTIDTPRQDEAIHLFQADPDAFIPVVGDLVPRL